MIQDLNCFLVFLLEPLVLARQARAAGAAVGGRLSEGRIGAGVDRLAAGIGDDARKADKNGQQKSGKMDDKSHGPELVTELTLIPSSQA